MWIYYYASFGPGHQSNNYGFQLFPDDYEHEDIEEYLFDTLSDHHDIILNFWEVERLPAVYVEEEIKNTKDGMKNLRGYLKRLEAESCFCSEEKDEEDLVLIKNLIGTVIEDLLRRLHKAGFMYSASDISNWRHGKKYPTEPNRSKILKIIRRTEKYPSYSKK